MHSGVLLASLSTCRCVGGFFRPLIQNGIYPSPQSTSRYHGTCASTLEDVEAVGALSRTIVTRHRRRRHFRNRIGLLGLATNDSDETPEAGYGAEDPRSKEDSAAPKSDTDASSNMSGALRTEDGAHPETNESGVEKETENHTSELEKQEEDGGEPIFLPVGDSKDLRLFRARLLAGSEEKWQEQLKRNVNVGQLADQDAWAHELSTPEKGCLIIAKSTMFSFSQTYFNQAVIFLASHDETGSAGFILNRPTSMSLGSLIKENSALEEFHASPIYLGGDVGEGNVQIIHPYGPEVLSEAMPIIPGVFVGGSVTEANRLVAQGLAKAEDFKFYLHLCGWAPGQLESEIKRGVWFAAACSSNVIMKHCISLPVPLWREVMTLMGPKYGLLARDTYDDL